MWVVYDIAEHEDSTKYACVLCNDCNDVGVIVQMASHMQDVVYGCQEKKLDSTNKNVK